MTSTTAASSSGPFILTRASTPSDFDLIVALQFKTFSDPHLRETFMGPDNPHGHANLSSRYQNTLRTNPSDVWIKVEEKETGMIVGASNWRIHMGSVPEHELAEEDSRWWWLKDDEDGLRRVKSVYEGIMETRKRLFTEPYCQLHICFTDPDYQRRGIGSMMLQWGSNLADQLFLPSWVEASPAGNFLYRKFGYKDVEIREGGEMQGSTMKREARVLSIECGQVVRG